MTAPLVEDGHGSVELKCAGGVTSPFGGMGLVDQVEVGSGHLVRDARQPAKAGSGVPRHDSTQGPRDWSPQLPRSYLWMTDEPVETRSPFRPLSMRLTFMFSPTLTTQAELELAWRELMGPWSFGSHSVWMMHVVDDRPFPHLTEIAETEDPPDAGHVDGLAEILMMLDREFVSGARVAFLRSRPGKDVVTDTDRAWARTLYAAARRAGVPCEVVHLATRGAIRPIPADVVGIRSCSA